MARQVQRTATLDLTTSRAIGSDADCPHGARDPRKHTTSVATPDRDEEGPMCGIAGWVSYGRDLSAERPLLEAMTATVACRGPDAGGIWTDGPAGLGHRRLAIIDLEGGTQPMIVTTSAGTVGLTYCGEVYNFRELRVELTALGHTFTTTSDTEVVLRAYLQWGGGCAERLNGMYAFAIWDGRTRQLLMVRDRLGIKPLYYRPTVDGVLLGSEPKVILAHPRTERRVDLDGLRQLFAQFRTAGASIWAGVKEVSPGTTVTIDARGASTRAYWRLGAAPHRADLPTTVATVRQLLSDTVARQLVADVPTCVLLSGGLDSSTIAALAANVNAGTGRPVRTFAIDVVGRGGFIPDLLRETEDKPFAHQVSRHLGTDHTDVVLDAGAIADAGVRRATVTARDAPGFGDTDQSLYLMFKAIRRHATVALSGESADEVFGGYRQFHDRAVLAQSTFPWLPNRLQPNQIRPDLSVLDNRVARLLCMPEYTDDTYATALADVPRLDGETADERRMREVCHLHLTHFLPLLLERKDRMSMATGLEIRVPFCDHRLVEYVFNAPWTMKVFDGREKSLLRAAVQDLLPSAVLARKKSVYPCVYDIRYLGALRDQVRDVLSCANHGVFNLFDRGAVVAAANIELDRLRAPHRVMFERVLETSAWIDLTRPTFQLS
jgi:asparagine synthase (glutamine-hydrolysing)